MKDPSGLNCLLMGFCIAITIQIYISSISRVCFSWAYQFTSKLGLLALVVKDLPANTEDIRDASLIPGLGRFPGGRHGNPLQYSCLENSMNRGVWWALVHRLAKSQTRLKQLCMHSLCIEVI